MRVPTRILSPGSSVASMSPHYGRIDMDTLAAPILGLQELSRNILATAIGDLTDADAKLRSRGGAGPSIAWTIGHLCHFKLEMLELLGQSRENPFAPRFADAGATEGDDYPSLDELAASYNALQDDVRDALSAAGDRLTAPIPGHGMHGETRALDRILFLAWHEAYHIGGIGAIRREQHRTGIADLVAAA